VDDIVETLRHPPALIPPCILLLLSERPDHGYALVDRLKEFGFVDGSTASLYRELRRLEDLGLAHSYWQASQTRGPARRVYELTSSGRGALDDCANGVVELSQTLGDFLARCKVVPPRRRPPVASLRTAGPIRA
jgi:DNA-binding PadR family transcriptional regulator